MRPAAEVHDEWIAIDLDSVVVCVSADTQTEEKSEEAREKRKTKHYKKGNNNNTLKMKQNNKTIKKRGKNKNKTSKTKLDDNLLTREVFAAGAPDAAAHQEVLQPRADLGRHAAHRPAGAFVASTSLIRHALAQLHTDH